MNYRETDPEFGRSLPHFWVARELMSSRQKYPGHWMQDLLLL